MLSIWIGRAGSGKSARVLETIQRERENRPQLLLVPEHTSHEAELDLCRFCGPTACRSAEVLTFQSLATRVLGETGGLADSIHGYWEDEHGEMHGNGFTFANYSAEELSERTLAAIALWNDTTRRARFVKKIMTTDFSWGQSAKSYLALYETL